MYMTSEWVEQWLYVCHRRQHAALAVCVKNKLVVLTTECMVTLVADKLKRLPYNQLGTTAHLWRGQTQLHV